MASSFQAAALEIVDTFGCPVFPLHPKTKNPATAHGYKDASFDPGQIARWWSKNPNYNVAYATGNAIVIDVDDHSDEGGVDGRVSLSEWERINGELPKTVTVKTGRGKGFQMVFANPDHEQIKNTANEKLGLDIRGYGGYCVAPGSIHPNGNKYRFINDPVACECAPINDQVRALISWIKTDRKKPKKNVSPGSKHRVSVGGRNDTLFREASRLQGLGLSDQAVASRILSYNAAKCDPPLSEGEVIQAVNSALRYQKGDHGDLIAFFEDQKLQKSGINDKTLGRLFALCASDRLAYVPEVRSWLAYDGKCWIKSGGLEIATNAMKDFITAASAYCVAIADDDARTAAVRSIARYQQHNARASVLEDAKSEMVRHLSEFDKNPHVLNCQNVTIDFSSGEPVIRDHDPADMITQVAGVSFDPSASCDQFRSVLASAVDGDADFFGYVQKLYGKVVAGDTSDDQVYFWGETPRSGKGTVTAPLVEMLGTDLNGYAKNCQPETFAVNKNRNASSSSGDRARLRNAKLIITSEPPKGMELDAALVKEMSGGDLLTARFNYGEDQQFRIHGLIFMLANSFPMINDPSVFDSGRAVVIPFRRFVPIEQRDQNLRDQLKTPEALSGLLNFCIEGVMKYREEGFKRPEVVVEESDRYIQRMDEVANFEACCLVESDTKIRASEVRSCYESWCQQRGRVPIPKGEFYDRLRQRSYWRDHATIDGVTVKRVIVGRDLR